MDTETPFVDHAAPILSGAPDITDDDRANLWDIFHQSNDHNELIQKLAPEPVPDQIKQQLFEAKKKSMPVEPADKAAAALTKLGQIDPSVLDIAESHPKVTAAFLAAATKVEKSEAAASEKATAGQPAGEVKPKTPLKLSPRPDGQPHLPPIPDNHYRVRATDGGIHDIPAENIDKAREIDPTLHVLNP